MSELLNQPATADGEVAGAVAAVAGMDCLTPADVRRHAKHIQAAPMILLDANLPAACLQVQPFHTLCWSALACTGEQHKAPVSTALRRLEPHCLVACGMMFNNGFSRCTRTLLKMWVCCSFAKFHEAFGDAYVQDAYLERL